MSNLNEQNQPLHIALIPDGNRRWARARNLKPWIGHLHGFKAVEKVFEQAFKSGVKYVSIWIASRDNILKRDKKEVEYLLKLFETKFNLLTKHKMVHKREVHVDVLGDYPELCPKGVINAVEKVKEATKKYNKFYLTFFLAYSGTKEMMDCIKKISDKKILDISREVVKEHLYTKDLPPVDLVIRTGGEPHNSDGFLMWDTANSQIVNSPKNWPDFKEKELDQALKEYSTRKRRMGA